MSMLCFVSLSTGDILETSIEEPKILLQFMHVNKYCLLVMILHIHLELIFIFHVHLCREISM
jgi:hypothetical protein